MKLEELSLNQFKNNRESKLKLSSRINIFVGDNGAGKTNILDAIYYLSFCKSPFNMLDNQNILHGENYFMIKGEYQNKITGIDSVQISFTQGDRKKVKCNDKEYDRLIDHIGDFPLVMISPGDVNLIYGGSEDRRKYIDGVISQFDKHYLVTLVEYNKILQQRNALLKSMHENQSTDQSVLEILNQKLSKTGNEIYKKRTEFLQEFIPLVKHYYQFISNEKESAGVNYKSKLKDEDFNQLLSQNFKRDLMLKHTSIGIHRDDLEFELDGFLIKKYGSQGQQKSFLIALKIAQFEFTFKQKKFKPLLLLDDIFDKLDFSRVQQLMKLVSRNEFGQIFITDTNKDRIEEIFVDIEVEKKIFLIEAGIAKEI